MRIVALCVVAFLATVESRTGMSWWDELVEFIERFDNPSSDKDQEDIDIGNGNFISFQRYNDPSEEFEPEEETEEMTEEDIKSAKKRERLFTTEDGDYLHHDCLNIKELTQDNWNDEPWTQGYWNRKLPAPKKWKVEKAKEKGLDRTYVKYNSAYGIPMIGTSMFSDEAMIRGCYLIRYIFADNQHMRIAARRDKWINLGFEGGVCCPSQMNTNQLSCPCEGAFPNVGQGAPAHEMAHRFIKQILSRMFKKGQFKLPEYVDPFNTHWKYQKAYAVEGVKCTFKSFDKMARDYGEFYTWVWNAQRQDRIRKTTKCPCKMHHYMIYSGQEKWLFKGNKNVMKKARECFWAKSPNLYNLMEQIFPCSNFYVPVCKDASYGFKLGAAQSLIIGKADDPTDPSKMNCRKDLDKPEVKSKDVPKVDKPKKNTAKRSKCFKIARQIDRDLGEIAENENKKLEENAFAKYLKNDEERPWWLRRCCPDLMKFNNKIQPPTYKKAEKDKRPCEFFNEENEEDMIEGDDSD